MEDAMSPTREVLRTYKAVGRYRALVRDAIQDLRAIKSGNVNANILAEDLLSRLEEENKEILRAREGT
jgi:hypothetical protein